MAQSFVEMIATRIEFFRPKWCKSGAAVGGFFRKMQLKTLTFFLGCIGLPRGVKRCKSSGLICPPPLGSPTLTCQFQWGGNSWKVLPLQPTAATHTWQFQWGGNSCKVLPLQPIAAHSYMAISVRGVIPEKSSHCSPLQPTLTWQFQSGGGGNSSKVLPLQPNSYIILPPLNKLPPHSYINLPPIDKLPPPPPTLTSKLEDFREDIRPGQNTIPHLGI